MRRIWPLIILCRHWLSRFCSAARLLTSPSRRCNNSVSSRRTGSGAGVGWGRKLRAKSQMVGPGGFEDKLHRARIFFGCLDQLTEACMVIAQLRWQSQRRCIEIEFVFGDIDRTVEKIFLHRLD